jgi:hypothetical protein
VSATIYPHLEALVTALKGLKLVTPVEAYASLAAINIQGSPQVALVAGETTIKQKIGQGRTIASLHMQQEWQVVVILRDAGDQKVTAPLLNELGVWQAKVLNILCKEIFTTGGPINLLDIPQPESIAGGAIAGRIRLGIQFVFTSE